MSEDLKLDTSFTDAKGPLRPIAIIVAVLMIAGIALSLTTGFSAWLLPMDDSYSSALVPKASDGAEPIALRSLEPRVESQTLSIHGMVGNRTDFNVSGLQAVIEVMDRHGLPSATVTVPVQPADLLAKGTANFDATIPSADQVSGFSVKFQLEDGPQVPHKDERPVALPVNAQ